MGADHKVPCFHNQAAELHNQEVARIRNLEVAALQVRIQVAVGRSIQVAAEHNILAVVRNRMLVVAARRGQVHCMELVVEHRTLAVDTGRVEVRLAPPAAADTAQFEHWVGREEDFDSGYAFWLLTELAADPMVFFLSCSSLLAAVVQQKSDLSKGRGLSMGDGHPTGESVQATPTLRI